MKISFRTTLKDFMLTSFKNKKKVTKITKRRLISLMKNLKKILKLAKQKRRVLALENEIQS